MDTSIRTYLFRTYGVLMDAKAICKVLHYPTVAALMAARTRGKLRFRVVEMEGRRGVFAATEEVAQYLEAAFGEEAPNASEPKGAAEAAPVPQPRAEG